MTESSILDAALSALEAGLCPIRAKADGSKAPLGQWKQWQSERPDETEVRSWFADWPNVGLVTGQVSDRLVCLEFEGRAMESLSAVRDALVAAELYGVFQSWVDGYCEETPGGGIHILVHVGGDNALPGNTKLASDSSGQTLIETRGEGGFVITAPSNGATHPTGGSWSVIQGGFDSIAWATRYEFSAVCAVLASFDETPVHVPLPVVVRPQLEGVLAADSWVDTALAKLPAMSAVLEQFGWLHLFDDSNYQYWSRPGKQPAGTSATVNANGRLFVHSSNASPVPCSSPSGETFDVADVILCYELGRRPSSQERVELASQYRGAKPAKRVGRTAALVDDSCYLVDGFWQARPVLDQINVAARSRRVAPDAVLAAVLARVAACSPHTICLPPLVGGTVPLSYMSLLVGPPETGKSAANRVATALIPAIDKMADGLPVGTGEGLIDILFAMVAETDPESGKQVKVRRQVLHNAYVYIDEGAALTATGSRSGATIMPTLRTIFTGGILGNTLADAEKRRIVPAGAAVYGVIVAVQPEVAAGLLSMGEVLAGTPQRFTFTSALDPRAPHSPPDWPGVLAWSPPHPTFGEMTTTLKIANEIHDHHRDSQRGAARDRLDAHLLLRQEKAAAILAILEGRLNITDEDWQLAAEVMATSNAVRDVVQARISESSEESDEAADQRVARRAVRVATAKEESEMELTLEQIVKVIARHPDGVRRNQLYRDGGDRVRRNLDAALAVAVERGLVEEFATPGQGTPKRQFKTRQ